MRDFTDIERRMRLLVASLKDAISKSDICDVNEFIEYGEYGVALDLLKYVYDRDVRPPSHEALTEMHDLAKIMEMKLK